jgi:hypothetical protein
MTTPGFLAEASVYKSSRHYRRGGSFAVAGGGTSSKLIPQLRAGKICDLVCNACEFGGDPIACLLCSYCGSVWIPGD